jgi:hypothetical protein
MDRCKMINIQTITDAYLYTYGSWTSQTLTNSAAGFLSATNEWGYLIWDEENIGTGYTGQVRLDVLNATDNSVLVGDIIKNTDGTPSDISSYALTHNIKIRVRLYGADWPTPAVKNIRVKHKNWNSEQVIFNDGKNLLLNRLLTTPTSSAMHAMVIGNGETSPLTETNTGITNPVCTPVELSSILVTVEYNETEKMVYVVLSLSNADVVVPNGTVMNSIAFKNDDTTPIFLGGSTYTPITKDVVFNYKFKSTFKVFSKTGSTYVLTSNANNIMLNRLFKTTPTYSGLKYGVVGFQTNPLSSSMTALDSTLFGPSAFNYTVIDTSKIRLSNSIYQGTTDGNNNTYNAIGHLNGDGTPIMMFASLIDENITKTSTYIYQYITNYNILTPVSTSL